MARGMARQGQQKENMTSQPSPSHEQSGDEKSGRSSENESEYSDDETYDDDIKPQQQQSKLKCPLQPTSCYVQRPSSSNNLHHSTTPPPLTTPPLTESVTTPLSITTLTFVSSDFTKTMLSTRMMSFSFTHTAARTLTTLTSGPVLSSVESGVATVTLNRPDKLNALNYDMIEVLTPLYAELDASPDVHAIVMRGAGGKAFCAGGDVVSIIDSIADGGDLHQRFFRDEYALDYAIGTLATPHVALYNGIAMGGGIGLSVHGAFRVSTPATLMAMPETKLGLLPDVGGTHFLPRLPYGVGMYMGLTGARVKGRDLVYTGISTHHFDAADDDKEPALLAALQAASSGSHADVKDALDSVADVVHDALDQDAIVAGIEDAFGVSVDTLDAVFGAPDSYHAVEESLKAIAADPDAPAAPWAAKTLSILSAMCPMSLLVTFAQLKAGASLDLASSFVLEGRMVPRMAYRPDFTAGVSALLVNKVQIPPEELWSPNNISDISQADVDAILAPYANPDDELVL